VQRKRCTPVKDAGRIEGSGTTLCVSELPAIDVAQYPVRGFVNLLRKGGHIECFIPIQTQHREVPHQWPENRGTGAGPIALTNSGERLDRTQAFIILNSISPWKGSGMITATVVENRIDRIAGLYAKVDELLSKLPAEVPQVARDFIKHMILENEEMKEFVEGIRDRRPPRFVLVGRTGVGKSSLVNAMCGKYLAKVSDVTVGTLVCDRYAYTFMGRTIFEIIDTRGVGESIHEGDRSAEEELKAQVREFRPDAILFLVRAKERAYVDKDATVVYELSQVLAKKIPIMVVVTQVDELETARIKDPSEYDERKRHNIRESVGQVERIVADVGLQPLKVLAVSSYVEWNSEPTSSNVASWDTLHIVFDGRYHIDELLDLLESNIDLRAGIYLMLVTRIDRVIRNIGRKLSAIFAAMAAMVATTPIPVSDIMPLLALQAALIMLIAYLAGTDMTYDAAKGMITALAALGVTGFTLRMATQQGSKLLNWLFPGAGSAISASIAGVGTYAIGVAAVAYFIDDMNLEDIRRIIAEAHQGYPAA